MASGLELVVQHDAVDVVGDLAGVAELGRGGEAAPADRSCVGVQRHPSGLGRRDPAGRRSRVWVITLAECVDEMTAPASTVRGK